MWTAHVLTIFAISHFAFRISQRKWAVSDGVVRFSKGPDDSLAIPAHRLIEHNLHYAAELERIV